MAGDRTPASLGLRIYLGVLHLVLCLAAALFAGLAIGGLRGEWQMQLASVLVALGWLGFFAWGMVNFVRGWPVMSSDSGVLLTSTGRWLVGLAYWAPFVGLPLAIVAFINCGPIWVPVVFHWFGLAMTVVVLAVLYSLSKVAGLLGGELPASPVWVVLVHCGGVVLVWSLFWSVAYFALLRDDVVKNDYSSAQSGFLLPWRGGEEGWVIQGNNAGMNHNTSNSQQKFAFDFRRQCGTPLLAAKGGTVLDVVDGNDGLTGPNNMISVTLDDGTSVAYYLHIQANSAVVKKNQSVDKGQMLARVGCVGNTFTGHIHFAVRASAANGAATIPVTFDDVKGDDGIPRTFGSYTSGNRR